MNELVQEGHKSTRRPQTSLSAAKKISKCSRRHGKRLSSHRDKYSKVSVSLLCSEAGEARKMLIHQESLSSASSETADMGDWSAASSKNAACSLRRVSLTRSTMLA